jgi:hypothetical protein
MELMNVNKFLDYLNMIYLSKFSDDNTYIIAKGYALYDISLQPSIYFINSKEPEKIIYDLKLPLTKNNLLYIDSCDGINTIICIDIEYIKDVINVEIQCYKKRKEIIDEESRKRELNKDTK